jgi:hypothetical protein
MVLGKNVERDWPAEQYVRAEQRPNATVGGDRAHLNYQQSLTTVRNASPNYMWAEAGLVPLPP